MTRTTVAWATVVVLLLEAFGLVFVNAVLATVVGGQNMSLAGLDPDAVTAGAWIMAGIGVFCLLLCCTVVLRAVIKNRAPGRAGRLLLIGCAVAHGVAGALTAGLVGWAAFAFFMCALGLLVLTLLSHGRGGEESSGMTTPLPEHPGDQGPPPGASPLAST